METVEDVTASSGSEKTVYGLQLPLMVKIKINEGGLFAAVQWNVEECPYDAMTADRQDFSVTGTVLLPDYVTNPNNVNLDIMVNVSVM